MGAELNEIALDRKGLGPRRPTALEGDVIRQQDRVQGLQQPLGGLSRNDVAGGGALRPMQTAADNIAMCGRLQSPEADIAVIGELDDAAFRHPDRLDGGHSTRNEGRVEIDVIFHDDRHRVAASNECLQRQEMAAVTAVFACKDRSAVVIVEGPRIEADAVMLGDDMAIDGRNAHKVQAA
jgi:hypothetical protein